MRRVDLQIRVAHFQRERACFQAASTQTPADLGGHGPDGGFDVLSLCQVVREAHLVAHALGGCVLSLHRVGVDAQAAGSHLVGSTAEDRGERIFFGLCHSPEGVDAETRELLLGDRADAAHALGGKRG